MSKVIRARYENGILKPLEPLDLKEGEEITVVIKEDLLEFARRVRESLREQGEEPGELLSKERSRFG